MPRIPRCLALTLLLFIGCSQPTSAEVQAEQEPADPSVVRHFDASTAGSVRGRVTWRGMVPVVRAYEGWANPLVENGPRARRRQENPCAPRVDRSTNGVANAVVFLREVDPRQARVWDHPPAQVVMRDHALEVHQGNVRSSVGFVRRGDAVRMVSKEPVFHGLHVDGSAFFSLMFPDPGQPLERALTKNGIVELTSAAGYYWMRGYLFVDDHPYYARTDSEGRFTLDGVPPGHYRAVCWMANWNEHHHERDPETAIIIRLALFPPVEREQEVLVRAGQSTVANFSLSSADFPSLPETPFPPGPVSPVRP
jgi:hypothetical protein